MQGSKFKILIVEDDEDHILLIKAAFRDYSDQIEFHTAGNGLEALSLIQKHHQTELFFNLILLDLNIPMMNGYEFLKKVKLEQELSRIPVIILTTTDNEDLLKKAYSCGANSVIKKDKFFDQENNIGKIFFQYWMQYASLSKSQQST
ncbi:MAG: response regulator [Pseudomonadota bacterium]